MIDDDTNYSPFEQDQKLPTDYYFTPKKGLDKILDPKYWLEDTEIDKTSGILRQSFPHINGLQSVCVVSALQADKVKHPFLQMIHTHRQHWVTVTTIDCNQGTVRVFDSMYRRCDPALVQQIVSLIPWDIKSGLKLEFAKYQVQRNKADCGLFAIAAAVALAFKLNPSDLKFDDSKLRGHLHTCLSNKKLSVFPSFSETVKSQKSDIVTVVECCACSITFYKKVKHCSNCSKPCHEPDDTRNVQCSFTQDGSTIICRLCFS